MCMDAHPDSYGRTILHIPIDDIDDITPHMSKILDFIDTSIQSGSSVLVHCALGLNRSVAAILTYLCRVKQINSFEALKFLKTKKSDVKPSALFLKQIDQYYGRDGEREDPMVGFHRRLQDRKAAALQQMGNE
ncbi:putative dual specificity protein phosphatase 16 [Cadophora sp. DSE1049]|nr:putative dual specificity protein phosphatase 16 [Cadophora sp. DSE1049]